MRRVHEFLNRRRRRFLGAVAVALLVWPAAGFIGVPAPTPTGLAVFDSAGLFMWTSILTQAITEYEMLKHSLQSLNIRHGSILEWVQIGNTVMRDIHGESLAIGAIVNGLPGNPQAAWANATVGLTSAFLAMETPGSSVHLSNAASVNMTDAFSADAIATVGGLRATQMDITKAITDLQAQADALDEDTNTPVAQQNITNAAIMQSIKLQQTNASLLGAAVQQLAIGNTWQRMRSPRRRTIMTR